MNYHSNSAFRHLIAKLVFLDDCAHCFVNKRIDGVSSLNGPHFYLIA